MIDIYVVQYADGTLATYIDGQCALSEVLANYHEWLERRPEVESNFRNLEYKDILPYAVDLVLEHKPLCFDNYAIIQSVPLSDVFEEDLEDLFDVDDPYIN